MFQHVTVRSLFIWGFGASLLIAAVLVWQPSFSAFSSTTAGPASSFAAGSVALSDDDSGTVMFVASGLHPGSSGTKCIAVTSTGTLASTVKLYAAGYSSLNALGDHVNLVIDEGTGGSFSTSGPSSCTGFTFEGNSFTGTLSSFAADKTSFATGVGSWAPIGSSAASKTFRFAYTLDAATPNSAQSGIAAVELTWEAQNS